MALFGDLAYALLAEPQTVIGTLIPHVIVEETYRDEVIITDHPVERGAAITDHAFVRPSQLEIRCGWSNSTAGTEGYIESVYQQMLTLLRKREPFDVFTPRRMYTSMLIQGIQVTRDERTNSVLNCSISLREIIIAQTQTTQGSESGGVTDTGYTQPTDSKEYSGSFGQNSGIGQNTEYSAGKGSFGLNSDIGADAAFGLSDPTAGKSSFTSANLSGNADYLGGGAAAFGTGGISGANEVIAGSGTTGITSTGTETGVVLDELEVTTPEKGFFDALPYRPGAFGK